MQNNKEKMRSDDRILVIRPIEGQKVVATTGLIDPRLFTGERNLHAIRGPIHTLWGLRYEQGILPKPLMQKFTNFQTLMTFCEDYFKRRGLQIVEVKDVPEDN